MLLFDNRYECKLSTRAMISIEKALGDNPINILYNTNGIPQLNSMLNILYYCIRKNNPQIRSLDDTIDIYDEYCEHGGSIGGLAKFLLELIKDSGMIKSENENESKPEAESETEKSEKN